MQYQINIYKAITYKQLYPRIVNQENAPTHCQVLLKINFEIPKHFWTLTNQYSSLFWKVRERNLKLRVIALDAIFSLNTYSNPYNTLFVESRTDPNFQNFVASTTWIFL